MQCFSRRAGLLTSANVPFFMAGLFTVAVFHSTLHQDNEYLSPAHSCYNPQCIEMHFCTPHKRVCFLLSNFGFQSDDRTMVESPFLAQALQLPSPAYHSLLAHTTPNSSPNPSPNPIIVSAGPSILLEEKNRRLELAMYCLSPTIQVRLYAAYLNLCCVIPTLLHLPPKNVPLPRMRTLCDAPM